MPLAPLCTITIVDFQPLIVNLMRQCGKICEDFVLCARLLGASDAWVIWKHLIPATFSHIIVIATLSMPAMILAESALSFLGLGLRPPLTSWGVLLKEAQNIQTLVLYPWLLLPGLFVAASILAFNFLGDGLRDAADPYTV